MQGGGATHGLSNGERAGARTFSARAGPAEMRAASAPPPLTLGDDAEPAEQIHVTPGIAFATGRCSLINLVPPPGSMASSPTHMHMPPSMHADDGITKFMVSPVPVRGSMESQVSLSSRGHAKLKPPSSRRTSGDSETSDISGFYGSYLGDSQTVKGGSLKKGQTKRSVFTPKQRGKHGATRIFLDQETLKKQVIANLSKPQYHVHDMYYETGCFQRVAKSNEFESSGLFAIALNALWIAIDTDYNTEAVLLEAHTFFQLMEHGFCAFFTFEIFVRFMAFARKLDAFRDQWFVFDSSMWTLMVAETWIMSLVIVFAGGNQASMGNAGILRLLRLLRLSRIARMARLLRCLPELMILLKGMYSAARSVFFTLLLIVFNIYIFAIAFAQMTSNTDVGERFFDGVVPSMYTLTLRGTLLDSPHAVANALGDENYAFVLAFLVFILLTALTVMNMLIGVLCEVVSTVAAVEKEEMAVTMVKTKLHKIVHEIDEDGDMTISKEEFSKILSNKEASSELSTVGIDVVGLIDFADFIFMDSQDASVDRSLSFPEFMEVVLSLRGSNQSTVKDIIDLRKYMQTINKTANKKLHEEIELVHGWISQMEESQREFVKKSEERHTKVERQLNRIESLLRKTLDPNLPDLPSPSRGNGPRSPRDSNPASPDASRRPASPLGSRASASAWGGGQNRSALAVMESIRSSEQRSNSRGRAAGNRDDAVTPSRGSAGPDPTASIEAVNPGGGTAEIDNPFRGFDEGDADPTRMRATTASVGAGPARVGSRDMLI